MQLGKLQAVYLAKRKVDWLKLHFEKTDEYSAPDKGTTVEIYITDRSS